MPFFQSPLMVKYRIRLSERVMFVPMAGDTPKPLS